MAARSVDYRRWVNVVEQQKSRVSDPKHLQMLDCFIEHMVSERSGDIDRFMRTMIDEPIYRSWGRPRPPGAGPSVRRGQEIRTLYLGMMNRPDGFPQFDLDTERFFVGDDGLAMDGVFQREARGYELDALGEELPPGGSPDGRFVLSRRMALFISFRDGLMCGEDTYFDARATVEPLDERDRRP
jgi:hypothetical protein